MDEIPQIASAIADLPTEQYESLMEGLKQFETNPRPPWNTQGLAVRSGEHFLNDLGFFGEPSPEQLEGINPKKWKAFRLCF